jgi:glycosyltransferase involved in cell wall biosynthesis
MPTRKPLFSIIVPTYQRAELLKAAIDSVLRQTIEDFECIVVDDGSDPPAEPVGDRRVRLLRRQQNGGQAPARNVGLNAARGRYVTFLDDDDVYTPDRLAIALEGLSRAPVAVCWTGHLDEHSREGRIWEGNVYDSILAGFPPHLGASALRRDLAVPFDERFQPTEDAEWWLRVASSANVATVPQIGHLFRGHWEDSRHRGGLHDHLAGNLALLKWHSDYFVSHASAAAFRWKRVGLMANDLGDYSLARAAFRRALRSRVELRTAWHFMRSLRPSVKISTVHISP